MSDLRTVLDEAAGPSSAPSSTVLDGDVARGHRALRRARGRRYGIGGGLVAAAAAAALAVGAPAGLSGGSAPNGTIVADGSGAGSATLSAGAIQLVAYEGQAPAGFTLATVPAGWEVQDSTSYSFVLAPQGKARPGGDFEGTIVVSLAADVPEQTGGTEVTVKGAPARILANLGDNGTRTLYQAQPSGGYLTIQVWGGLPLDDAQLVGLADGIGVTADAELTYG